MELIDLENNNPPVGKYTVCDNEFTVITTTAAVAAAAVTETTNELSTTIEMKAIAEPTSTNDDEKLPDKEVHIDIDDKIKTPTSLTSMDSKNQNGETETAAALKPGSKIKPNITKDDAENLIQRLYGITMEDIKELISYDDRNYYVTEDRHVKNPIIKNNCTHGYVLKIINALDSKKIELIDAQTELMLFLGKHNIVCPKPIANIFGRYYSVENFNGVEHVVKLLEFIPGKIFHEVNQTKHIYYECGEFAARIDRACKNFQHNGYETNESMWRLKSVPKLREFLYVLQDHSRKAIIEEIIDAFEKKVLTNYDHFEKGIIHGDINEQNIVVHKKHKDNNEYSIFGIIDFGDTSISPLIFELAIAMTYMILQSKELSTGGIVMAGYNSIRLVENKEKKILKECVAARMAQSLVMGAYTISIEPDNDYVLRTQNGWELLESLWKNNLSNIDEIWQDAGDEYLKQSHK